MLLFVAPFTFIPLNKNVVQPNAAVLLRTSKVCNRTFVDKIAIMKTKQHSGHVSDNGLEMFKPEAGYKTLSLA